MQWCNLLNRDENIDVSSTFLPLMWIKLQIQLEFEMQSITFCQLRWVEMESYENNIFKQKYLITSLEPDKFECSLNTTASKNMLYKLAPKGKALNGVGLDSNTDVYIFSLQQPFQQVWQIEFCTPKLKSSLRSYLQKWMFTMESEELLHHLDVILSFYTNAL